jgi:hypothetical protein
MLPLFLSSMSLTSITGSFRSSQNEFLKTLSTFCNCFTFFTPSLRKHTYTLQFSCSTLYLNYVLLTLNQSMDNLEMEEIDPLVWKLRALAQRKNDFDAQQQEDDKERSAPHIELQPRGHALTKLRQDKNKRLVALDKEQQEEITQVQEKYAQKRRQITTQYETLYTETLEQLYKELPFREVDHLRAREAEATSEENALRWEAFELVQQAADALKSEKTIYVTKRTTASAAAKNETPPYTDGSRSSTSFSVPDHCNQHASPVEQLKLLAQVGYNSRDPPQGQRYKENEFHGLDTPSKPENSKLAAQVDGDNDPDAHHSPKRQINKESSPFEQFYDIPDIIPDIDEKALHNQRAPSLANLPDPTPSRTKNPVRAVALVSSIERPIQSPKSVPNRRKPVLLLDDNDDDDEDFTPSRQKPPKRRKASNRAKATLSNRTLLPTHSDTLLSPGFNINFISYDPGSPSRSYPVT